LSATAANSLKRNFRALANTTASPNAYSGCFADEKRHPDFYLETSFLFKHQILIFLLLGINKIFIEALDFRFFCPRFSFKLSKIRQ